MTFLFSQVILIYTKFIWIQRHYLLLSSLFLSSVPGLVFMWLKWSSKFLPLGAICLFALGNLAHGAEIYQDHKETVKAEVIEILEEKEREVMGTDTTVLVQTVRAEILEGKKVGTVAVFENDITKLKKGDKIFINRFEPIEGGELISFHDIERRPQLFWLAGFFVLLITAFAGWHGLRAILSLSLSLLAILFLLVPALLAGHSPIWVSFGASVAILASTLFITHGFKPHIRVAFFGTMLAVLATCLLSYVTVIYMRFTGFSDDSAVFLNFATGGSLDFAGLLLGSIIIGLLGVLDDVSVTQASVVHELKRANPALSPFELYKRAIRVGRDHIGSLVNTLALAYIGASLPLVLYFSRSGADFWLSINQEIIASEIVRIILGSAGLILAVPFTTALAAWYFKDKVLDEEVHVSCGHRH